MILKCIAVDDEPLALDIIEDYVSKVPFLELVKRTENAIEALQLVQAGGIDLVFLDIQMPKADGFSLLRRFEEIPFEVVFVTSFDKYAINAIRFSALDYLLKPIDVKDLAETILKARKRIAEKKSISVRGLFLI